MKSNSEAGGIILRRKSTTSCNVTNPNVHRRDPNFISDLEQNQPQSSPINQVRKRSILKHGDSFDSSQLHHFNGHSENRLKGVLKKDSSYDETLKPILKNQPLDQPILPSEPTVSSPSSTSSSEDLKNTPFSDVVIDPIPGSKSPIPSSSTPVRKASLKRDRKPSLKDRQPVIPPSSVKLSSDDRDLADKLEKLAVEAENIKKKQLMMNKDENNEVKNQMEVKTNEEKR